MIGLGRKSNRWGVMMGYNSFYVVLMLCYVYVIVIYDGVCACGGYVKYAVWRPITNTHENMANIMSTGCGSA